MSFASTDPEVPFSWSEEDVSDLYGHTTVLLAAEGEGVAAHRPGGSALGTSSSRLYRSSPGCSRASGDQVP